MIAAGCGPGRALCITVIKWMTGVYSVYSDSLEDLPEMLIEDVMRHNVSNL
jgi:hypothetical protein